MLLSNLFPKLILALNLVLLFPVCGEAQTIPDSTLRNDRTSVTPNQIIKGVNSDVISGGAVRGSTLFHSFESFNVDSGRGVYFTDLPGSTVTNILTRVTGNNASNISGVLGVLGDASLFLVNPQGIGSP